MLARNDPNNFLIIMSPRESFTFPIFLLDENVPFLKRVVKLDQNILFQMRIPEFTTNIEYDGVGKAPYDPEHNSTAIFSGEATLTPPKVCLL